MRSQESVQSWLMALEAERHDQTYKKPKPLLYQPVIVEKEINHQKRDRIMFQAGRHAEGARDAEAIKGHKGMQKLLGGNNAKRSR